MNMMRREFLGGLVAAGGMFAVRGAAATPRLRFGVMSDVHIGGKKDAEATLEKCLRWFRAQDVDAILCPGDIAHSGLIAELEAFAAVWRRVFPDGRGRNGGRVELMISTGNHDIDAWGGRWKGFSDAQMDAQRFNWKDNPAKVWARLFGETWDTIWRKTVKGYTFVGAQWSSLHPPLAAWFKEHAAELRGARPFFFCQHAHPKGTCHVGYAGEGDGGASVPVLSAFPNAVAVTGHSHCALTDERAVWQGAFTSIGAGCIHEGALDFRCANGSAFWHPSWKQHLMAPLQNPTGWGGDDCGGGMELIEVFDDRLVVHRQSVYYGMPLGPSWTVPLPAAAGGPLDFAVRKAARRAPSFAPDAVARAAACPAGHRLESKARQGEPCVYLSFPRARTAGGGRVFDYVVRAEAAGAAPVTARFMAAGFARPEAKADQPGECLFAAAEFPPGTPVRFTVTPRDCFGLSGRPLTAVLPA